jgi:valyl-tRNA synthetase
MVKARIRTGRTPESARKTLGRSIFTILRLLHPLIPFVTETIWTRFLERMRAKVGDRNLPLVWAPWPQGRPRASDAALARRIFLLQSIVSAVRAVRTKYRISGKTAVALHVSFQDHADRDALEPLHDLLSGLVHVSTLKTGVHMTKPPSCATEVHGAFQVFVPFPGGLDETREVGRLRGRKARLEDELIRASRPLESWEFHSKAPKEVRDRLRKRREMLSAQILHIEENIAELQSSGGSGIEVI